jgi:hypothetical protein
MDKFGIPKRYHLEGICEKYPELVRFFHDFKYSTKYEWTRNAWIKWEFAKAYLATLPLTETEDGNCLHYCYDILRTGEA